MENREVLFKKIEEKEKEWAEQVQTLQANIAKIPYENRREIEEQINRLSMKLKELEKRSVELKKITSEVPHEMGEKIVHYWIELFVKVDGLMSKLKE